MAKTDKSGSLYFYAVLYHPNPTKDQNESGDYPKSEVVILNQIGIVAKSEEQVAMLAAREIPEKYLDKLDDLEVIVRPF